MAKNPSSKGDDNRASPISDAFRDFIRSGWTAHTPAPATAWAVASFAAARRTEISGQFPEKILLFPAGTTKQRSNDTDYPFRPHSAFTYFTGWGFSALPDSVLLGTPTDDGHHWSLLLRPPAPRTSDEFYARADIGEFWTGRRPSLEEVSAWLGLDTGDINGFVLKEALTGDAAIIRESDPDLTDALDSLRKAPQDHHNVDSDLARAASEMRLVKDSLEISELQEAVHATHRGFADIIAALPGAVGHERGERVVEGAFNSRARIEGNGVGYDSIVASGSHACILHWVTNDGPIRDGDLLLIDAGVERDSLYTADITRTLPVNGRFSAAQREVYDAVLEAADAAFALVKPGIVFRELHAAAMQVIARRVSEWGLLPLSLEETLHRNGQLHRRYMIHGTSHHLGLDVHDCAGARKEMYIDGVLEAGMVFTIEPGLYFQPDDETVPLKWRGIGVRIEDNILVTREGGLNLSAEIPRTPDAVEAWVAR